MLMRSGGEGGGAMKEAMYLTEVLWILSLNAMVNKLKTTKEMQDKLVAADVTSEK
jgi:hypothetical protein